LTLAGRSEKRSC